MSDESIIQFCAPTLAGIKTGSLFSSPYQDKQKTLDEIRNANHILSSRGLRLIPLEWSAKRVLIYVYRPDRLAHDFNSSDTSNFLKQMGYEPAQVATCVQQLSKKICCSHVFPHEIGLFLGYPLVDVKGFIDEHAQNYYFSGMWKVYGNPEQTKKLFYQYDRCTKDYVRANSHGFTLERLAVKAN